MYSDRGSPVVTGTGPPPPRQLTMPPVSTWKISPGTQMQQIGNGALHLTSQATLYGSQLTSPIENVNPNACYVITSEVKMHKGGIDVAIVDTDKNKILRNEFILRSNW